MLHCLSTESISHPLSCSIRRRHLRTENSHKRRSVSRGKIATFVTGFVLNNHHLPVNLGGWKWRECNDQDGAGQGNQFMSIMCTHIMCIHTHTHTPLLLDPRNLSQRTSSEALHAHTHTHTAPHYLQRSDPLILIWPPLLP